MLWGLAGFQQALQIQFLSLMQPLLGSAVRGQQLAGSP
jgi:hypothetical protein